MTETDILHSNEALRRLILNSLELDADQVVSIELDIDDVQGAQQLLADAGVELGDLHPSIFNTE
jgi:uncharacterized protein YbjQ (UPF0145 family)